MTAAGLTDGASGRSQPATTRSDRAVLLDDIAVQRPVIPQAEGTSAVRSPCLGYSAIDSPEPPSSLGKSLSFGRPSFIGRTVDA
jgi:hypothetical protein